MTDDTPELVQDIREEKNSISDTLDALKEFRDSISEYSKHIENMDANERKAFYQSADQLREQATNATTPEELLALEDDVEQAVRSPLEQVAEESLEELLRLIQPDLSDDVRSQTFEKLESKIPAELDKVTAAYQDIYQRVDDFPEILREVLALTIEETPSVLQTPEQDLKPTVESLKYRYETLTGLETTFKEQADWLPDFELANVERFYSDVEKEIDESVIKNKLATIVDAVETLTDDGIQVEGIIQDELESWYGTGDISRLLPTLREIEHSSTEVAEKYKEVDGKISKLGIDSTAVFDSELDELHATYTQLGLHDYSSLENLEGSLDEVDEQIEDLINDIHKRLKAQKNLVEQLDAPEEESPPQVHLGPEGSPLLPMHVADNPSQALKDCNAFHEWITTHLAADTDDIDQDDMLEVWQSLSGGGEVRLTEENQKTIMALANRLPLSVVLSGT